MPHLIQQENTSNNRKPIHSIQRHRFSRKQITRLDIKQRDPFVKHRSTILHSPGPTLSIIQVQHPLMIRVRRTHPTTSHESTNDCSPQGSQLPPMIRMPRLPNPPTATTPQSQPPYSEDTSRPPDQPPLYVNAKQFKRILKRRDARQIFQEKYKCAPKGTQGKPRPYMHESRHRHAMTRPRGPGGRYLPKEQIRQTRTGSKLGHAKGENTKEESAD